MRSVCLSLCSDIEINMTSLELALTRQNANILRNLERNLELVNRLKRMNKELDIAASHWNS